MPKTAISVPAKEDLDSELEEIERKSKKKKKRQEKKTEKKSKPADGRLVAPMLLIITLLIGYLIIVLS